MREETMNIPLITTRPTDQEPLRETREALRAFLKSFQGEPEIDETPEEDRLYSDADLRDIMNGGR
jgi:hypothetical protein